MFRNWNYFYYSAYGRDNRNNCTTPTGCGNSIGSATVTASGGVPAYTYTWGPTPGSGTSISGLGVGSYSVIVADAQGCSSNFKYID
jgi:hypothetical protein